MPKYQIEYKEVSGGAKSYSYSYFDAEKDIESAACEKANEKLKKDKENAYFRSFGYFKPLKTLTVREMDMVSKKPKRGGHKFTLRLRFLQTITVSGRKDRQEWYEYND